MDDELAVKIEVPAELKLLRPLNLFVRGLMEQAPALAASEKLLDDMELVFNEAFMNVHDHAYRFGAKGRLSVEIILRQDRLEFRFEDEGESFDPNLIPPPDPDETGERGRGVWLMRQFMDQFIYRSDTNGKNLLRLIKNLPVPGR
ncbi:MAG: ATP-binding protein [Desulfomonile tiedjei]|nr:ATP-binding protein [Desulfomonile tiedjei]